MTEKHAESGAAVIKDGAIVICVPLSVLDTVIDGAWALGSLDVRFKVTDPAVFAKALVTSLNREDEQGTTAIHRMFDAAINDALEDGAEGIEEHEDQEG